MANIPVDIDDDDDDDDDDVPNGSPAGYQGQITSVLFRPESSRTDVQSSAGATFGSPVSTSFAIQSVLSPGLMCDVNAGSIG